MAATIEHPSFLQPDEQDTCIWRYMDLPKFEWLLANSRLYMPSLERFDDDWEGIVSAGERAWWGGAISSAATTQLRNTFEHNLEFVSRMTAGHRRFHYVSCWHQNEFENTAMWGNYTTTSDSIAIKAQYSDLREQLSEQIFLGKVQYRDFYEPFEPGMNMFDYVMRKDVGFEYEREVRAVSFCLPLEGVPGREHWHLFQDPSSGNAIYNAPPVDLPSLIRAVVFNPESSDDLQQRVALLCDRHGLAQPIQSRRRTMPPVAV